MPVNDNSLGRSIRKAARERFAERRTHPRAEPDEETRRIVREIHTEFARFGPKQVAAQAGWKYGVELDLDMVRGALVELSDEGGLDEVQP